MGGGVAGVGGDRDSGNLGPTLLLKQTGLRHRQLELCSGCVDCLDAHLIDRIRRGRDFPRQK